MPCVICSLPTGDACVPLCAFHMPLSELATDVEFGFRSDWPLESGTPTHIDHMLGCCSFCEDSGDCGHPEHDYCCVCELREQMKVGSSALDS